MLQTFVYLFAPLCHIVRETDFEQAMRLVSGKKIWSAMWDYRHPDVDCFTAQVSQLEIIVLSDPYQYFKVKPKKAIVRDVSKKKSKDLEDPAGIFMGERE